MSNPVLQKNATKQKQIEWNVEPKKKKSGFTTKFTTS